MTDRDETIAALAALPAVGPRRLRVLLAHHPPQEAWAVVRREARPHPMVAAMLAERGLGAGVARHATDGLRATMRARLARTPMRVLCLGDPDYPAPLRHDPAPPAVVFARGDLGALAARRAGLVGTRSATAAGRALASHLGHGLGAAGVAVVSGLARGIDAWAHRGACAAREAGAAAAPVAVVACGLDVAYPREHRDLWRRVEECGIVLSESPPGTAPEAYRFPLRNRILAALSEVLVVVESRETGGAMLTVGEAERRGITVLAVPGSPRNAAAAGTNLLVSQGCAPVTDVDDVLVALGLDRRRARDPAWDPRPAPDEAGAAVLSALRGAPCTLDELVARAGAPLAEVARALGRLEAHGWVHHAGGWWEALTP
ncbi:MAG: DNA-processing protein DprA [Acidimicrobiia bacterium]